MSHKHIARAQQNDTRRFGRAARLDSARGTTHAGFQTEVRVVETVTTTCKTFLVACGIGILAVAHAQDVPGAVDGIFGWATGEAPGCAVAVSQHGEVVVNRGYGLANLEQEVPITPGTRFDVGSLQKQFIAAAVLLLVEEGRLSLADEVRTYVPELPAYGHAITVDHLLTHTSGIRDWNALLGLSQDAEDALTMILRQRGLNHVPGEEMSYSNSNYVLAKEIVARVTGMAFSEFLHERLLGPLGMERTIYADDVRDVEDRALAYERDGDGWRLNILVGHERGDGGGLLGTASDILKWNDALSNASLGAFVTEKLHEPTRLNNGRELSHSRGLYLEGDPSGQIVWYTGAAAGYKSALARLPDQGLSLAVLCNAGESAVGASFMNPIVDLFVPKPSTAEVETGAVDSPITPEDIDVRGYAGLYFNARTKEPLRLVVHDGRLRVDGGPALLPVDENRFRVDEPRLSFMSEADVELDFTSPQEVVATTSEGEAAEFRRAQPYEPTTEELDALAGRYRSAELNATLDVRRLNQALAISLNGSPPLPFVAVDPEAFQLGRIIVRFIRDEAGTIVGLDYSNPVLRRVSFTRAEP